MKRMLALLIALLIAAGMTVCAGAESDRYDLDNYGYRTVTEKGRGSLVFQSSPKGSFMREYRYHDGDAIFVNLTWRQNGYAIAYEDGVYGYVDASYIDWGTSGGGSGGSGGAKDLSVYEYRVVDSRGRGSLVFQKSPRGSFMYGHRFYDGDWIYVNPYWRQDGYAMAYDDGEFGYVDASYIDWSYDPEYGYEGGGGSGEYMGTWTVAFCDSWVSLRERPSSSSSRLTKVYKWEDVEVYYYNDVWWECYYDGYHGYIKREYLTDRPGKFDDYPY